MTYQYAMAASGQTQFVPVRNLQEARLKVTQSPRSHERHLVRTWARVDVHEAMSSQIQMQRFH
jgi:hypothetical protein